MKRNRKHERNSGGKSQGPSQNKFWEMEKALERKSFGAKKLRAKTVSSCVIAASAIAMRQYPLYMNGTASSTNVVMHSVCSGLETETAPGEAGQQYETGKDIHQPADHVCSLDLCQDAAVYHCSETARKSSAFSF